jgi:hypothetical protein
MHTIRRLLWQPIASDLLAGKLAQILAYVAAIGFFVIALKKIATMQLTEEQLFFGVLQVLILFLVIIHGGTLARIEAELTKKHD